MDNNGRGKRKAWPTSYGMEPSSDGEAVQTLLPQRERFDLNSGHQAKKRASLQASEQDLGRAMGLEEQDGEEEDFEMVMQDEARYHAIRYAPTPCLVCDEAIVKEKQAEIEQSNDVYKTLARKSFQLSITLLDAPVATFRIIVLPAGMLLSLLHSSTFSSFASLMLTLLSAPAIQLSKLHGAIQTIMGWAGTQKHMVVPSARIAVKWVSA